MQVSEILNQPLSTAVEPTQFDSRFQVSVPLKLTGHGRCSVTAEYVQAGAGGWYVGQKACCHVVLYAPGWQAQQVALAVQCPANPGRAGPAQKQP